MHTTITEVHMIDAFAFLDITRLLCAWNVYRAVLQSPPQGAGWLSEWFASSLRALAAGKGAGLARELALEEIRARHFPERISRLEGLYCFLDRGSAERALDWPGRRFRVELFAELGLESQGPLDRLDANWISYARLDANGFFIDVVGWAHLYWAGAAMPGRTPVWETLVRGRATVYGTNLRERAYEQVLAHSSDILQLSEAARLAAWSGYTFGNCCAYMRVAPENSEELIVEYYFDERDLENPQFIADIGALVQNGHPVRPEAALAMQNGDAARAPDFSALNFRVARPPFIGVPATKEAA